MSEKETGQNHATKLDIDFDVRPSTVFYEEWYNTLQGFTVKERDKAYKYIFEYAFYGIEPDIKDKTLPSYVSFRMARPNIDSAQKRYDESKENGKKGGRPKKVTEEVREKILKLRKNGMTQKHVASELCLSLKTIQRVEKDKSQNHNVNVNNNVNDNVNVKYVAYKEDNIIASQEISPSEKPVKKKSYNYDDLSDAAKDNIYSSIIYSCDYDNGFKTTSNKYKIPVEDLQRLYEEKRAESPFN